MKRPVFAICYGSLCHILFLLSVFAVVQALYTGMLSGQGHLRGWPAIVANGVLLIQFPLVHSYLLSSSGRGYLSRPFPVDLGRRLSTITYVASAAIQLLLTTLLWNPSGIVWWQPHGAWLHAWWIVYGFGWLLLGKAVFDANPSIQLGTLGWWSVFRGRPLVYPKFPRTGLCRFSRQPVYFAFFVTVWTGPVWTPDHLAVAIVWSLYLLLGPRLKERRLRAAYGEDYAAYQRRTPYFFPWRARLTDDAKPGAELPRTESREESVCSA